MDCRTAVQEGGDKLRSVSRNAKKSKNEGLKMPKVYIRRHFRNRKPVRAHLRRLKKIPQKIGTLWYGQKQDFIHGPRKKQTTEFVNGRVYIVSQDFGKKRHLILPQSVPKRVRHFAEKEKLELPKDYRKKMRLKVGTLKKNKKLGVQSFITPIKGGHYNVKKNQNQD